MKNSKIKSTFLLLIFIVLISTDSHAQLQWAKKMGGTSSESGNSIAVDSGGNVYTTGSFIGTVDFDPGSGTFNLTSLGSSDIFISKVNSSGNFIWAKKMGSTSSDQGMSIALDTSGNLYTTGSFRGTVDFDPGAGTFNLSASGVDDIFISKLDASGNFSWAKKIGGSNNDQASSIALDSLGNIYTTGYFSSTADFDPGGGTYNLISGGGFDIFISKLDAAGNFSWAKNIGGSAFDEGNSIALDGAGNVYTTGYFGNTVDFDPGSGAFNLSSAGTQDIFISKLDFSGNFIWAKKFGSSTSDYGNSIALDAAGNVYTTGQFTGTVDFDPGTATYNLYGTGEDIFISKLDPSGNFVWAKQMGSVGINSSLSIALDASGNIYTTGEFAGTTDFDPGPGVYNLVSTAVSFDVFISKLDALGTFVWAERIGSTNADQGNSITTDLLGNIYATGSFNLTTDFDPGASIYNLTSSGNSDAFIMKYNYCGANYDVNYSSCDSIILFGTTYLTSGSYVQQFSNLSGCDSNLNMHIAIHNTAFYYPALTVCDSLNFGALTLINSGSYIHTFTNIYGCDSIVNLNLTVKHSSTNAVTQTACNTYTLNSQTYTASGVYTQTFINSVSCDSIITLNLTINHSSASSSSQTACNTYTFNSQTYTASGVYTQTLVNAVGCDSILNLNLTINHSTSHTINHSACLTYTLNGQTYTLSGNYSQLLTNSVGCDSNINLNLIINLPSSSSATHTACDTYTLNSMTYTLNGIYSQLLTNASGCDSVLTLNLTINHSSTSSLAQTACNYYTLNSQTYTSSGTFTQTLTNAIACDSILTLNLTINTVNTLLSQSGNTLTANASGAIYQWVNCPSYSLISGATNQNYTASGNGDYAVIVTQNGCTDTSVCYTVTGVGINDYFSSNLIQIIPNPSNGKINIQTPTLSGASLKLINITGQTILQRRHLVGTNFTLDLSDIVKGVYFLEIVQDGKIERVKIDLR